MPQQSSIFFSQDGLRSGWSALLFILLLSIVLFCRGIFLQGKQLAASDHAVSNFAFLTPQIIIILCCTVIAAAILCVTLLGGGGNFGVAKVSATCVLLLVWLSILVIAVVSSAHTRQAAEQVAEAKRNASIAATAGFPALSRLGPEVSQFAVVLIATRILSRVEHRPFGAYGLGGGHWRQFGHGLTVGLTALSMLVGLLWWGRWMTFERLSSDWHCHGGQV